MRAHGRRVAILTTLEFHRRSRDELAERYGASTSRARKTLPEGVETIAIAGAGETMVWLPEPRALIPGDRLLGDDAGGLRLCPDSWLRYLPSGMGQAELRDALAPAARPSGRAGARLPRRAGARERPRRDRAGARGVAVFSFSMRVILPDETELELPDGATGLDAARAIGPKLAEQAVLVRANGSVRDLRLPLADGEQIQILTTRDREDPDALYVLRHSAAHLLAEAARRLYPGTKVAIGPPIENGFYYDFEFPEPVDRGGARAARGGDPARDRRGPRLGSAREIDPRRGAQRTSRRRASPSRSSSWTRPRATSRSTSRATSSTSAAGRTCRTPSRSRRSSSSRSPARTGAATRTAPQLTRVYGTAFFDPQDLEDHLHRSRRRSGATTGASARTSSSSTSPSSRRACPSGTRAGW